MDKRIAVFLAGGEGDRPLQFSAVMGTETLLAQTIDRVVIATGESPLYCVVHRTHARLYREEFTVGPGCAIIEQPGDRGTAAAVVHAIECVRRDQGDDAVVGMFPTDQHVACTNTFARFINAAYSQAAADPSHVYIVGVKAESPEPDGNWIDAAPASSGYALMPRCVRGLRSRPGEDVAKELFDRGSLRNTNILFGRVAAFDTLIGRSGDASVAMMRRVFRGTFSDELFATLPTLDFSQAVLERSLERLRTLELAKAGWVDLGRAPRNVPALRLVRPVASKSRLQSSP